MTQKSSNQEDNQEDTETNEVVKNDAYGGLVYANIPKIVCRTVQISTTTVAAAAKTNHGLLKWFIQSQAIHLFRRL